MIIHGNCLEELTKLEPESIDLVIVDPPYNISQPKNISRKNFRTKYLRRNSDIRLNLGKWDHFKDEGSYLEFTEEWFQLVTKLMKEDSWIYIFFAKEKIGYISLYLAPKYGIKTRTVFTWCKSNPVPSFRKTNWLSATEHIYIGSKGAGKIPNFLTQKEMYNYMVTPNKSSYGVTNHPTEKPVNLVRRFIKSSSKEDGIVLDCFAGSGTIGVAAKQLNRRYILIEQDDGYIDIINDRLGNVEAKYLGQMKQQKLF